MAARRARRRQEAVELPLWRMNARRMRSQLGLQGAPFCVAMRGADEALVRSLAEEVRTDRRLGAIDR